jgi:hypothetical protein
MPSEEEAPAKSDKELGKLTPSKRHMQMEDILACQLGKQMEGKQQAETGVHLQCLQEQWNDGKPLLASSDRAD